MTTVLCVGDPLVALLPDAPVRLDESSHLGVHVGGAEVNTAVGLARLGISSAWLGRVGVDPLGSVVINALQADGVDTSLVVRDPAAPTGLYLREWQADGLRRPFYYRAGSAGSRLQVEDWPSSFRPQLLHITGITPALSTSARTTIEAMVARARQQECLVSFDPNYRPALWASATEAKDVIGRLAEQADLVLLSEDDAELLVDSMVPDEVFDALTANQIVFKRGDEGAIGRRGREIATVAAEPVADPIDPVGAGDAFNAGFLAGLLATGTLTECLQLGAFCGARTVSRVGEHTGAPRLAELPDALRVLLVDGQH